MAKQKGKSGVPNKHLHARLSYLQRAANYLTFQTNSTCEATADSAPYATKPGVPADGNLQLSQAVVQKSDRNGLSRHLINNVTQVARKSQIRLPIDVKRGICKRCGNTLIQGKTSDQTTENLSWKSRKPHADVVVVTCGYCNTARRYPVGTKRQPKKKDRSTRRATNGG